MPNLHKPLLACLCLMCYPCLLAQIQDMEVLLESRTEALETADGQDLAYLLEQRAYHLENPVNLNSHDRWLLAQIRLLNESQVLAIEEYISLYGELLAVEELQAIDALDMATIERIRPFVMVRKDLHDFRKPLAAMLLQGQNEILLRWGRFLEQSRGYTADGPFHGSPDRLYFRFRHQYANTLSYGITAEKDPGEPFFRHTNTAGFDFYAFHVFLRNYRKWLPQLALGDYAISLGQGLLMHAGFGVGKGALTTRIRKGGQAVRPYTSVAEDQHLRGIAATVRPANPLEVTLFYSGRRRDGNILMDTSLQESRIFTAFQTSGLHRTTGEIADKNAVRNRLFGGRIRWLSRRFGLALNVLSESTDIPLLRRPALYHQFQFEGRRSFLTSVDFRMSFRKVHTFGEIALSQNGHIAMIQGAMLSLDPKLDVAIHFRHLPVKYHALRANIFAESQLGSNETGIYIGLEVRPHIRWKIQAYADQWTHPWLRFNASSPSKGHEQLFRLTYTIRRKLEAYLQYKHEFRQKNRQTNEHHLHRLEDHVRQQVRCHLGYRVSRDLELRNRLEYRFLHTDKRYIGSGFLIYQDVLYKPLESPFSFTARIALFDVQEADTRIYAYENDLINQFSIPSYSNEGIRYYLNVKYATRRNMTVEVRYARTKLFDQFTIGSGHDEIEGNTRTELKAQLKLVF